MLALLGVPALIAVASPLPATIPAAAVDAVPYLRSGEVRPRAAAWSVLDGIPETVAGGPAVPPRRGPALLIASGVVLVVVGLRVLWPIDQETPEAGTRRRQNRPLLVATAAGIGVFTGLLANGGGFPLVPAYLLIFGLRMRQAVGTSLVVIAVLAAPTLAVHWALGHISWPVAGEFAAGLLPGSKWLMPSPLGAGPRRATRMAGGAGPPAEVTASQTGLACGRRGERLRCRVLR